MESQVKNPVWKLVGGYILVLLILIAIVLMSSCGARKAQTSISNTKDDQSDKSTSVGSVSNTTKNVDSNKIVNQNAIVNQKQQSKITELFNENGTLKSRITELLNQKDVDSSVHTETRYKWLYTNTDSIFNNTHYITRTITIHEKEKKTDANNNALYWTLFGLGALGIIGYFVYTKITGK